MHLQPSILIRARPRWRLLHWSEATLWGLFLFALSEWASNTWAVPPQVNQITVCRRGAKAKLSNPSKAAKCWPRSDLFFFLLAQSLSPLHCPKSPRPRLSDNSSYLSRGWLLTFPVYSEVKGQTPVFSRLSPVPWYQSVCEGETGEFVQSMG